MLTLGRTVVPILTRANGDGAEFMESDVEIWYEENVGHGRRRNSGRILGVGSEVPNKSLEE